MNKQHDIAQRVLTTEQRNEFIRRTSFISESDRDTRAAFVDEIARAALASAPVADERAAVAYLDLGAGGYMDVGTDLTDEQLAALPKGRHMLAIIGTHGVNGYTPASAPVADERPAFEAYARRNGYPLNGHGGFYGNNRTRNQWMGWKARAAMASAPVATRQYHYRMSNCTPGRPECRDGNGHPECPCWHDVGTGPLAGKEATATDWRDKPSAPVQWPTMPPSKGQSPVLFEDGYAEGWAKCMGECRRALVAASNYIDKLGGDSKTYRAVLTSAPVAGEAVRDVTLPDGTVRHNVGSDNLSDEDRRNMTSQLEQWASAPVDARAAVDPCGYVAVKVSAVDWLKDKFPALTIKAGLCERIGGRLYTITRLMRDHDAALASAPVATPSSQHFKPPFDNCSFRMCDLPGQCRGEGKCHHPASAPVVGEAQAQGKLVAVLNVVENGFGRTVDVEMLEAGNQLPTGRWAVRLAVPAE